MNRLYDVYIGYAENLVQLIRRSIILRLEKKGDLNLLVCPPAKNVFEFRDDDFVEGVVLADPETEYTDVVRQADMDLIFWAAQLIGQSFV